MLNIFILEDEFLQQTRIETVIKDVIAKKSLKCKGPEIFGKPSQLLDAITERGSHQLFFLDIEIKAKEIRKKDPNATIVFVTTHSEFMPVTFKYRVAALDFIDKALDDEEFYERVHLAIEYTMDKIGATIAQDSFTFETATAHVQVPFNNILFFETSPTIHKVILHTKEERMEFYASISEVERADDRLFRCHRSFIVNPENIVRINKEDKMVMFENNNECPISRTKYKGLLEKVKSLKS